MIATCLGQAALGHRVTLVFGREHDPAYLDTLSDRISLECVKSLVHPVDPIHDIRAVREMMRLFRALAPDIVHTHQSKAGIVGRLAAYRAKVPGIVHGVHIAPFLNVGPSKRYLYLTAERMMARLTDAFVDVSGGMRETYLAAGIGTAANHHVVYSGMPLKAFTEAAPPQNWRELAGVAADAPKPPIVLMLAALEPRKRHCELIRVFGRIVDRFPEIRLLCAGEGPALPDVEAAIRRAGLEKNVRLLGFHPEPGRLVALADLCLLTSMREGLPRVVVQALAGGKPVIVTRVAGIEEIVEHGVSGLITDPDDLEDTARAILDVMADPVLYQKLRDGAKARDVSGWSSEALVEGTEKVYATLADRRATATA
ncbi:glycosyltransferase [Palleronia aestuarii]|uniref:glycosyltransferase n=1 Tax=Palleronia aestuarii TaxID=568105 RepID=UPI001F3587DE|nr:glycosyltransferase [Palleronia aestuarii]